MLGLSDVEWAKKKRLAQLSIQGTDKRVAATLSSLNADELDALALAVQERQYDSAKA